MQKLFTSDNRVIIQLLKSKLEENGIPAYIKNENAPLAGELPSIVVPPELWVVNDEQYELAEQILYDELANQAATNKHWRCSHCGEKLEGQFNVCWCCGAGKEN